MGNIGLDHPAVEPDEPRTTGPVLLPLYCIFGAMFLAAGLTATTLNPLRTLQIPYPKHVEYAQFLIPAACLVIWLLLRRTWPNGGAIVAVLLCFALISFIPMYAESRVAKVPVRRMLDWNELKTIEERIGVPATAAGSSEGSFVIVALENEQRVRAELARLQILESELKEP